jgi:hypothetical protein
VKPRFRWFLVPVAGIAIMAATCQPTKPVVKPGPPGFNPCEADPVIINGEECGWAFRAADIDDGEKTSVGTFTSGPADPPSGNGSLKLEVGADSDSSHDAIEFRTGEFTGTKLSDITELKYTTYVENFVNGQAPYLTLVVDKDGDGISDAGLFFEPVYQTGGYSGDAVPNQCVGNETTCAVEGSWQTWDALAGGWWDGTGGPPLVTLANFIASNPEAQIVNNASGLGGVRITAGYGTPPWNDFVGEVDALTINGRTFDFEA